VKVDIEMRLRKVLYNISVQHPTVKFDTRESHIGICASIPSAREKAGNTFLIAEQRAFFALSSWQNSLCQPIIVL